MRRGADSRPAHCGVSEPADTVSSGRAAGRRSAQPKGGASWRVGPPADTPDGELSVQAMVMCSHVWIGQSSDRSEWQAPPRSHTSTIALAGASAAGCHICANSPGCTTEFIATGAHLLPPQRLLFRLGSDLRSNDGPAMGDGRKRETSTSTLVLYPCNLVGPDDRSERCLSESLDGATGLGRGSHRPLASAGCSRVQQRPPSLNDTTHADTSQGSPDQLEADTTSNDATTATRFRP